MHNKTLVIAFAVFLLSACVSNVKNPVGTQVMTSYNSKAVNVILLAGEKIPDRYDEAVRDYLNDTASDSIRTEFQAYALGLEPSADSDEDYTGEAFLTWLIQRQLDRRTKLMLRGDTEATLNVELKSTTWPNTATMMLVGEMIGTKFEFRLTDDSDEAVLESVGEISPFVQRGVGAGRGLVGLALRSGSSQHLTDLQRVADATAALVMDILTGSGLPQTTLKSYKFMGTIAAELSLE